MHKKYNIRVKYNKSVHCLWIFCVVKVVSSYGGADKVPISKELVQRARRSNASYKEDMRKAQEEEKARLATREREKEEAARKKADEANTEKWEKKVQDLQGKIKAKKGFIEDQNQLQKTALAKGEMMKTAEALRHNLRAAEMARTTVERESKELNDLQEQLARHMGKKPKKS